MSGEYRTVQLSDRQLLDDDDSTEESKPAFPKWFICCGGCCCCVMPLLFILLRLYMVNVMTGMAVSSFIDIDDAQVNEFCNDGLTMQNLTDNLWWPGCGTVVNGDFSSCVGGCINQTTMQELDNFNEQFGGRLVSYSSRQDPVGNPTATSYNLTGWFLPAPNHNATTPRIVLQHGFTSNSNKHRVQFMAYLLRKNGFSVLVNNFRDHCYSDDSVERVNTWGHAAPYDTLGAWDYAVNDPDNVFGGPISDGLVGVAGFSKGAFTAASLFGLEDRVPAIWVDAPPFTPKSAFALGAQSAMSDMGLGFMFPLIIDAVWANMVDAGNAKGVNIEENTPADTLPTGPDTSRPIFWVGNKDDTTVSYQEGVDLLALLESHPLKYQVEEWHLEGDCAGVTHCEDHIRIPAEYQARLCSFWTRVFGLHESSCVTSQIVTGAPVVTGRRLQTEREANWKTV